MADNLHVRIEHAGDDAPWFVFSNSLMTDLSIWDGQVDALKGTFNILRYDQRGHGKSPTSPVGYGFDDLGRDVLDLLDAHEIDRCTFVGLSMGVPTGLAAFRQAPKRFANLVLVDGQAKSTETSMGHWSERVGFAQANGMDTVATQTVARWLRPENQETPMATRLQAMLAATPLQGFLDGAQALKAYDQSAAIANLDIPVLLVAGENDGALPKVMSGLADALPKGTFRPIENAGHVPNFERSDEFNRVLVEFLNAQT